MDTFPFDFLQGLLLEMARTRPTEALIDRIVARFADLPTVALARVWLIQPGDICERCERQAECADRSRCLHLVASRGTPRTEGADWSRIDGSFRRFPLGVRKVGRIGVGEAVTVMDAHAEQEWIVQPEWAEAEGIRGFGGQPLITHGETLGALGVFTRVTLTPECVERLRLIADHAAVALSNARAFDEIDRLRRRLEMENEYLREEVRDAQAFGDIVGTSAALRHTLDQIGLVAPTEASVLILGESGTGKELVAREIHRRSARAKRPLVRVNCASVPHELYESEFFGHVRGAFTGAVRDRTGRFELASGGTLFLDEVGEIPLDLQSKLLRVLQEGQFERVGEERTRQVDVRVIAATNRNLREEVAQGRFREDLYYRLNVFPIEVAPLRERRDDIALLATHFLDHAARSLNCPRPKLSRANVAELTGHDWPGNVRELQNIIERAVITARDGRLRFDLPVGNSASTTVQKSSPEESDVLTEVEMRQRERANVQAALEACGGKIYGPSGAADLLGIRPTTLVSRLRKMGLSRAR